MSSYGWYGKFFAMISELLTCNSSIFLFSAVKKIRFLFVCSSSYFIHSYFLAFLSSRLLFLPLSTNIQDRDDGPSCITRSSHSGHPDQHSGESSKLSIFIHSFIYFYCFSFILFLIQFFFKFIHF